jgi:hypothetical protein
MKSNILGSILRRLQFPPLGKERFIEIISKIILWLMYCMIFYEMAVNNTYPYYYLTAICFISVAAACCYSLLYYHAIYSVVYYFFHNSYFSYLLFLYFVGFMSMILYFDLGRDWTGNTKRR